MPAPQQIVTVGLNPAIDRLIETPNLQLGAHQVVRQISRYPAGKAINVSRTLAILGRSSIATGFVGQEEAEQFERFLRVKDHARIHAQLLNVAGRTRENITLVDPAQHQETHLREPGFEVTAADIDRMSSKLKLLARDGVIVCFCGSLPRGLDHQRWRQLVDVCVAGGARVAVDTTGEHLRPVLEAGLWLIKPNLSELAELLDESVDNVDEKQLRRFAAKLAGQVDIVAVTLGANGALVVTDHEAWSVELPIESAQVRNTVGCGDCWLAGFVEGWMREHQIEAASRWASAAAATNASAIETADFKMDDVRQHLNAGHINCWTDE
jgi:1-phosphofructokinase family hexose kinase